MGLIDAGNPRSFKSRRGILADETTATPTTDTGVIGGETNRGDPRAAGIDQRSFGSFSEMVNDPDFRNDWSNVAGMAGVSGMFGSAIKDMLGLGAQQGPVDPNMAELNLNGSEGESPGLYAKGGKVGRKGLLDGDPPGPDNVIIGAKTGERILNEKQFGALSKEAQAEVERVLKARKK